MSHHEGVSCDSCLKGNFRGRRYKCLICFDYDCCSNCYENGVTSNRHTTDHPMQCILTRNDFDLFYGGESLSHDFPQAYTCPFCGKLGLTEAGLHEHVASEHADSSAEVICAICASIPGGEANNVTDDFAAHLTLEHSHSQQPSHRSSHHTSSNPVVTGGSIAAARTASSGIDVRDPLDEPSQTAIRGRRGPSRTSALSSVSNRSSRRQMSAYSSSGAALSPSGRDMDPISELLSQLSGVRRAANSVSNAASTASQLQQLQMQLQLERHSSMIPPSLAARSGLTGFVSASSVLASSDRLPIERVIRRHQNQTGVLTSSGQLNSQVNSQQQQLAHHTQLMSAAAAAVSASSHPYMVPDMPYIVLMDQHPSNVTDSHAGVIGSGSSMPFSSSLTTRASSLQGSSPVSSRFLLSRCNEVNLSESEQSALEISKADKGLFVQELIVTTLSDAFESLNTLEEEKTQVEEAVASSDDRVKLKEPLEPKTTSPSTVSKTTTDNHAVEEFQLPVTTLLWMSPSTESTNGVVNSSSSAVRLAASGVTKGASMAPETPPKLRSKSHAKAYEKV